jgi:hypothetical protein
MCFFSAAQAKYTDNDASARLMVAGCCLALLSR